MTSQMALCVKSQQETKQWSRINGWSFPLHLLQLLAWIFLVMFAMLFFGVLLPSLPSGPWQISCATITAAVFLCHVIVHLVSISLNPADPNVRAKNYSGPLPQFNRNQHSHVIENQYCYICEVKVGMKSKHCSTCNKCVSSFDHHCKWLNNCIGGRNYRLFIACVGTALLGCLIILVTSISLVTAFFVKTSWLHDSPQTYQSTNSTDSSLIPFANATTPSSTQQYFSNATTTSGKIFYVLIPVSGVLWLSVVIATCCLSFIAVSLLTHLLGFHLYLMCVGLSTYDYIVQKRDSTELSSDINCCCSENCKSTFFKQHLKKANQISPAMSGTATEELEMKSSQKRSTSKTNSAPSLIISNEKNDSGVERSIQQTFNSGNVYLGSPQRQRQFLEPLYAIRQQSIKNDEQDAASEAESKDEVENSQTTENKTEEVNHASAGTTRKRHTSASPASALPPIMESENQDRTGHRDAWYRSVSAQSLNSLSDDQICNEAEHQDVGGLGFKRINSSLSNLLFSIEDGKPVSEDEEAYSEDGISHGTEETRIEILEESTEKDDEPVDDAQWSVPTQQIPNGLLDREFSEKNTKNIQNGLKNAVSSSQNDLYSKNQCERRLSSTLEMVPSPITQKNNYFSGPLFKTGTNIIRIRSNSKDDFYGNKEECSGRVDPLERLDVYDSIVFDTHSTTNITPVV